jgi:predicted O-methyltransferase YrrM
VTWIQKFSSDAARHWNTEIDFLLIDGDHSEPAVRRDWEEWSPFIVEGGVVLFHDARLFDGGWTTAEYGPVKLIDQLFRGSAKSEWIIAEEVHSLVVIERQNKLSQTIHIDERRT